jgi:deoxyribose-phosphate aldolase
MNVKQYLDSTYLKTALQAGLTTLEDQTIVKGFVLEAIEEDFKLIMIRPDMVSMARKLITDASSKVLIGTVIDFPEGTSSIEQKLVEAKKAIEDGADELDFVCNYQAFKNGNNLLVKNEILKGTQLAFENHKTIKWIIEVAALNPQQIVQLTALIKNVIISNFKEDYYQNVFIKSSTGFYKTINGEPNGATVPAIVMMLENATPLPVKAAGGVRNYDEALEMIKLGVKRIGTSAAKAIIQGQTSNENY